MSTENNGYAGVKPKKMTAPAIMARKGGDPVVCLTAYTTPMARLLDAHCDLLLVGDSLGMVLYGMETTLGVTLDMMINHTQAVVRGASAAMVVVDMPFGTVEENPEVAFRNCARVMAETNAQGVKIEGGQTMAPTIKYLVERGIPVMGHVGLKPQSVNTMGGFKTQGRDEAEWAAIIDDAKAVADAGAFSIVVEGVAEGLGKKITEVVPCVTIGIGASAQCDGQILVTEDMLGLFERTPKFVKTYGDMKGLIEGAVKNYHDDVKSRAFPGADNVFGMKK